MEALSTDPMAVTGPAGAAVEPAPETRPGLLSRLSQYLGFTPAAVLFGVFFGAPMVMIVAYSFWTQNGYTHRGSVDASRTISSSSAPRSTSTRS